jgi:hypothetical protein
MSIRKDTQIVFVHKGFSWYLPHVLNQAKYASPNSKVVLLGTPGHPFNASDIQVENIDDLESQDMAKFIHSYRHMSPNLQAFEMMCFLRWFYLLEYMRQNKVQSVLHLDSDVLLYSSIDTISDVYSDVVEDCAYSILERSYNASDLFMNASAHISYWTIEKLEEFCYFAIDSFQNPDILVQYENKWNRYRNSQSIDGVSDMTTFYWFWEKAKDSIANFVVDNNYNVFDLNMSQATNYYENEYKFSQGKKVVKLIDKHPYFMKASHPDKLWRVHALHFQGGTKNFIPFFYTGNYFNRKLKIDLYGYVKFAKFYLRRLFWIFSDK